MADSKDTTRSNVRIILTIIAGFIFMVISGINTLRFLIMLFMRSQDHTGIVLALVSCGIAFSLTIAQMIYGAKAVSTTGVRRSLYEAYQDKYTAIAFASAGVTMMASYISNQDEFSSVLMIILFVVAIFFANRCSSEIDYMNIAVRSMIDNMKTENNGLEYMSQRLSEASSEVNCKDTHAEGTEEHN